MNQSLIISGTGFLGTDIILPSQIRDRIARLNAAILATSIAIVDKSNEGDTKFLVCFDLDQYDSFTKRWQTYVNDLSWFDININTVGVWDTTATYEVEFERWRILASKCGAKSPNKLPDQPKSEGAKDFQTTLLLGALILFLAGRVMR